MLAQSPAQVPVKYVSVQCKGGLLSLLYGICTQCMCTCPCLNLVSVHSCVCYQDLGILDPLWLINTYLLLKQEA